MAALENTSLLDRSIQLQPELLGDPEYRTGYIGKFHLGDEVFAQHGFQYWVSTEDEYIGNYYPDRDQSARSSYHSYLVEQGYQPNDHKKNIFTRDFAVHLPLDQCKPAFQARHASEFIMENREKPWLLHVSFLEPHMPFYGPYNDLLNAEEAPVPKNYPGDQIDHEPAYYKRLRDGFVQKGYEGQDLHTRAGWERLNRNYAGLCTQVDQALARILWALEASGQMENTIIVFTSDHGEMMGSHSLIGKSVFYQEAIRVPLFIRVPGQKKQVIVDHPISQINLVPTLLDLLGKQKPEKLPGESLMPLARGGKLKEDHVFIEWQEPKTPSGRTIISPQNEKLVLFHEDNNMFHDCTKDPLEMNNLYYSGSQERRITELRNRLDLWQKRTKDTVTLDA